jgi:hypothetical protein
MPDLTHLGGRVAVPADAPESAEAATSRALHEYWATQYLRHVAEGPGPAIAYLGQLRRHTEGVDPWQLLALVAPKAIARKDG